MSTTVSPRLPADGERELAIARLERRQKFWQDAVGFVAVNGVLWLIWALTDGTVDGSMPWPAWVTAIWGFLLALDGIRAFARLPGGPITEEEIEREIRRQRRS